MHSSCVLVLVLGVLTLGARGDGDTAGNSAVDESANSSSSQSSAPVVLLLLNFQDNGTAPGRSQGNTSHPAEPRPVLQITTLAVPEANGTEDDSNRTAQLGQPETMAEGAHNRVRRFTGSEAKLIRRKRTFHKHKGCMLCGLMGMMHQQPQVIVMQEPVHYQPQSQQCNTCQQTPVYQQPQPVYQQPQPVYQQPPPQPVYHQPPPQPVYHQPPPQPVYHQPPPQPVYHQPPPQPVYHQPPPQPMYQPQPQPQQEYCDPCQQKLHQQQQQPQQQHDPCGGGGCGGNHGSFSHSSAHSSASSSSGSWKKKK